MNSVTFLAEHLCYNNQVESGYARGFCFKVQFILSPLVALRPVRQIRHLSN
jgi:hypothetical protein